MYGFAIALAVMLTFGQQSTAVKQTELPPPAANMTAKDAPNPAPAPPAPGGKASVPEEKKEQQTSPEAPVAHGQAAPAPDKQPGPKKKSDTTKRIAAFWFILPGV